jgi:acyl-coenzyme A synthetase/AMP-(fatty) acid ligase
MNLVFQVPWTDGRDYWWHDEMDDVEPSCYPVWVSAEDPLFMLYTRLVGTKYIGTYIRLST